MRVRLSLDVEIHKADPGETGYWASVKGVPGCYSQGETLAEVRRNIREAIACHFDLPDPAPAKPRAKAAKGRAG